MQLSRRSGQAGAFGARITVFRSGGLNDPAQRITWWETAGAYGYLGQDDPVVHLGVGSRYQVDLRIDFPGGASKTWRDVPTNTRVEAVE